MKCVIFRFALLIILWLPGQMLYAATTQQSLPGNATEDWYEFDLSFTQFDPQTLQKFSKKIEDEEDDEFEDEFAEDELDVYDPLETLNRGIFWVNDKLYFYLLKPIVKLYRYVPEQVRVCTANFFSNLTSPIRIVNAALQFKLPDAGRQLARFTINSTLGVLGFFDPAKKYFALAAKEEDFGQTLGHYGIGPGLYLMLPFLGPSNLRDSVGLLVDFPLDPFPYILNDLEYLGVEAFDAINTLSLDENTYEAIKNEALDPYLFIRDAYFQFRAGKIKK